jgi:hypothetical protein
VKNVGISLALGLGASLSEDMGVLVSPYILGRPLEAHIGLVVDIV